MSSFLQNCAKHSISFVTAIISAIIVTYTVDKVIFKKNVSNPVETEQTQQLQTNYPMPPPFPGYMGEINQSTYPQQVPYQTSNYNPDNPGLSEGNSSYSEQAIYSSANEITNNTTNESNPPILLEYDEGSLPPHLRPNMSYNTNDVSTYSNPNYLPNNQGSQNNNQNPPPNNYNQGYPPPRRETAQGYPPPPPRRENNQGYPPPPPRGDNNQGYPPPPPRGEYSQGYPPPR